MLHLWDFVLGFTLLVLLRTAVSDGQPRVIGSLQPIVAVLGDDVILPCYLEPQFSVRDLTVEWSKPDLKPDPSDQLSRVQYVHLYRGWVEVTDVKIQAYVRRTALFADGLRRGNMSLKITNVTLEDDGRYRCYVPKLPSQVKDSIVRLVVEPKSVQTTETPLHPGNLQTPDPEGETDVGGARPHLSLWIPAVVVCVCVLVGVSGYLLKRKCQKQNLPKYDIAPA